MENKGIDLLSYECVCVHRSHSTGNPVKVDMTGEDDLKTSTRTDHSLGVVEFPIRMRGGPRKFTVREVLLPCRVAWQCMHSSQHEYWQLTAIPGMTSRACGCANKFSRPQDQELIRPVWVARLAKRAQPYSKRKVLNVRFVSAYKL
jgi:hypothetical protein